MGRKDIKAPPMILVSSQSTSAMALRTESFTYAGMMQAMMKAQRWDCRRIPNPTNRVKKMLIAPDGVFIKADCFESY